MSSFMLSLCLIASLWFGFALFYAPWGERAYGKSWPGYEKNLQRRRLLFIQQRATVVIVFCITLTAFLQSFRNDIMAYLSLFFLGIAFCLTIGAIGIGVYMYTYYPTSSVTSEQDQPD